MRLIVAGGRDFKPEPRHTTWLNTLCDELAQAGTVVAEVVCGMASGADTFGAEWARSLAIPIANFPAKWEQHGRAAGPKRNRQMAEYADAVVLFPGGRGTQNMYETAMDLGLVIYDWRNRTE